MFSSDATSQRLHSPLLPGTGGWQPVFWFALILVLIGDILVVASLFTPWLDVYKMDPSLPIRSQGYSPWLALQRSGLDAFGTLTALYMLVTLGFVAGTLISAATIQGRSRVSSITIVLALLGCCLVCLALWGIPINLEMNYPYYDVAFVYGGFLAVVGFLSGGIGAVIVASRHR